jgi:inorganic triphosphatase YgiF
MGREFELKFRATPAQQDAILQGFGGFSPISMETTYYDTPSRSLSARRITLRRRLENGISVCTLKTPGSGYSRGEWNVEETEIAAAIPVLCKLSGVVELPTWLQEGLSPLCAARFTRQRKILSLPEFTAELALDRGVLLGAGREQALCELELELIAGSEAALVEYAKNMAAQYGLEPESDSKFRRAMALATGE